MRPFFRNPPEQGPSFTAATSSYPPVQTSKEQIQQQNQCTTPVVKLITGFCAFLGLLFSISVAGFVLMARLNNQIAEEEHHYQEQLSKTPPSSPERSRYLLPLLKIPLPLPPISHTTKKQAADLVSAHKCLAEALYYEARGEATAGRLAVGEVILNRVQNPTFPDNICSVIYQGAGRRTGCQFSFTCDGSRRQPVNQEIWRDFLNEAAHLLLNLHYPVTSGATHYHADYVTPVWAKNMSETAQIGTHLFYKSSKNTAKNDQQR